MRRRVVGWVGEPNNSLRLQNKLSMLQDQLELLEKEHKQEIDKIQK